MVLNIFPRRREPEPSEVAEIAEVLPEPSPEVLDEAPRRRRSRGGRGRGGKSRAETAVADETAEAALANQPEPDSVPAPRRRTPRRPSTTAETASEGEPTNGALPVAEAEPPAPTIDSQPAAAEPAAAPRRRRSAAPADKPVETISPSADGLTTVLRAIEHHGRQIEQLVRLQEEAARHLGRPGAVAAPPARVGVFVDAANIELACDRLRARFDWAKILRLLTQDRQLVRAVAYSPIHDDPGVSIETQRFVEPFLDKGFKVVTKPLKRFQDGTIKANVDIELALDVITMLDRLDVVCLVSGDGDFQRLVELLQSRGVRVEVAAVGTSTASGLRHAADSFIDLQARLREIRA